MSDSTTQFRRGVQAAFEAIAAVINNASGPLADLTDSEVDAILWPLLDLGANSSVSRAASVADAEAKGDPT